MKRSLLMGSIVVLAVAAYAVGQQPISKSLPYSEKEVLAALAKEFSVKQVDEVFDLGGGKVTAVFMRADADGLLRSVQLSADPEYSRELWRAARTVLRMRHWYGDEHDKPLSDWFAASVRLGQGSPFVSALEFGNELRMVVRRTSGDSGAVVHFRSL